MAGMSYATTATLTAAANLASLASGTSWVTTAVSNAVNLYLDVHVWIRTKSSATASVNSALTIRVLAANELLVANASSSASVSNDYVRNIPIVGTMAMGTSATGSATTLGGPFSIASAFGGLMPQEWMIVVENTSGVSLQTSANEHSIIYQGLKVV